MRAAATRNRLVRETNVSDTSVQPTHHLLHIYILAAMNLEGFTKRATTMQFQKANRTFRDQGHEHPHQKGNRNLAMFPEKKI